MPRTKVVVIAQRCRLEAKLLLQSAGYRLQRIVALRRLHGTRLLQTANGIISRQQPWELIPSAFLFNIDLTIAVDVAISRVGPGDDVPAVIEKLY